ncbi:MAG: 30S ribosomal protein S12 methylthiotransferase RimO [Melioribacteraceae bacterium]|jgi:ribosomal protein S12 methylthiotransferase|nr:30S ribosomal protein S12 methylthiotransferase RimO [Melioribacteraceae bacterium]RJP61994.1 MAG: 30S ribosomal protein S12 methylthiotransferase RimO [Ignavibacteriales bacterium]WKZ69118.1 MAG: 30S ribosomal protein S12 methylthiotransferase RimO [Melioribacteraceae bacterium]
MKENKINIITLGCSKNTVDSERLMKQLNANNFELVKNSDDADSIVINTCGFIDAAKEESINTILQAVELKKKGKIKKVVVAGCLSERYMDDLVKDIPEVDKYFGTEDYEGVVKEFGGNLKYELLGERIVSTPKHYAYLKISEGCDNPCSFCAIPLMRGGHKSKPMEQLLKEAESLAKNGAKEIIIIGQDTTDYGKDIYQKRNLSELLNRLSDINGIEWIKLLYAYPSHFPNDVIETIAENPKVCKYLDMPLQHISDNVLRSMRRGISSRRTKELLYKIKERIPDITLRTTFIVGYPNETEKEFQELYDFVKDIEFDRMGVFNYSIEETTTSFILGDPFSLKEKERRKDELMNLQQKISLSKNEKLVGRKIRVLIDDIEDQHYIARSERDAPEVDGEVIIDPNGKYLTPGNFYEVDIYDCNEYDLFAKHSGNGGK